MNNVEFETLIAVVWLEASKNKPRKITQSKFNFIGFEGKFVFVIGKLDQQNSEFAKYMKRYLVQRIRDAVLVQLD